MNCIPNAKKRMTQFALTGIDGMHSEKRLPTLFHFSEGYRLPSLPQRPIDIPSVTDVVNRNQQSLGVNFVDDPVISDPESIQPLSAL